jgi:hypothetical protein
MFVPTTLTVMLLVAAVVAVADEVNAAPLELMTRPVMVAPDREPLDDEGEVGELEYSELPQAAASTVDTTILTSQNWCRRAITKPSNENGGRVVSAITVPRRQ